MQVTLKALPATLAEFEGKPRQMPEQICALFLCALQLYLSDKEAGIAAMNLLRGPRPMTPYDVQFLRDRLRDKSYLPLAYFEGAVPENNYTPAEPFVLEILPDPRPQDMEPGYLRLFLKTAGADSPRPMKLRQDPATGEWYLWEYSSILSGIRLPVPARSGTSVEKKAVSILLTLLLCLGLTACGGEQSGESKPMNKEPTVQAEQDTVQQASDDDGTYWTAVRYESYQNYYDRTEVSQMPTSKWKADLYLNEDGTAQFRELVGDSYQSCLLEGTWQQGKNGALKLKGVDQYGNGTTMTGNVEKDNSVMLETIYGEKFYLVPAARPAPGGELSAADLDGVWRMTSGEVEGSQFDAKEEHQASILNFDRLWSDYTGTYVISADYYSAHHLDLDEPTFHTDESLQAELLNEPLMYGIPNELWSIRLYREDSDYEYYITLTDRNTLYLQEYYELDNSPAARTAVYTRSDDILPEEIRETVTTEPYDTLIFYWRDPETEIADPLAAFPVTRLEENGKNKLLLVGRSYETQIRFCTGKQVLNADGTQKEWIADKVLYDGMIQMNEPQWFSLNIPEDSPQLCLFMKRSWDESWFTWPITDKSPFYVSEYTFLTPAG